MRPRPRSRQGRAARRLATVLRREVPAVLQLLDGTSVEELRIEQGDTLLFIRRALAGEAEPVSEAPRPTPAARPKAAVAYTETAGEPITLDESAWTVRSPCVGVFRASLRPGVAPQTQEGAVVSAGQVLGYVEAMGMMNDVEAIHAGRVVEVTVADGQPVEYGQPLFIIAATNDVLGDIS